MALFKKEEKNRMVPLTPLLLSKSKAKLDHQSRCNGNAMLFVAIKNKALYFI